MVEPRIGANAMALSVALATAAGAAWLAWGAAPVATPPRPPIGIPAALPPQVAPAASGVVSSDPARAFDGLNLVVSLHLPEAVLRDMDGVEVHRWRQPWPKAARGANRWLRAHLADEGGLFAVVERYGVMRLDRDGAVVWQRALNSGGGFAGGPDGQVAVLAVDLRNFEDVSHLAPLRDEVVVVLSATGEVRERRSLLDAWRGGTSDTTWRQGMTDGGFPLGVRGFEWMTAGDVEPFVAGRFLVAFSRLNRLAVVDRAGRLTWEKELPFAGVSEPQALPDGGVLLRDETRVLELDPQLAVRWEHAARGPGPLQRLANGNTLVVASAEGRADEVAPDGTTVWTYVNPTASPDDPWAPAPFVLTRVPRDAWTAAALP